MVIRCYFYVRNQLSNETNCFEGGGNEHESGQNGQRAEKWRKKKVVLKLLSHRKSSLTFAFFLPPPTHTQGLMPPRRVMDAERRMCFWSSPAVLAYVMHAAKMKINQTKHK